MPENGSKGTVIVDVGGLDQSLNDFSLALETGNADPTPRISFASYDLLHKVLAPNRMAIVRAMTGAGTLSIREVARRVGRDFKGVHSDVTSLLTNGLVHRTADGRLIFPYDTIHFDFEIGAAGQSAA